jgi:hypothetical protein
VGAITKLIIATTLISGVLNALIFVGAVIELLDQWVGGVSYFLWIFVAPIMSPAMIGLPWFDAWVSGSSVNDNIFMIWLSLIVCIVLRAITWKWAPDNE